MVLKILVFNQVVIGRQARMTPKESLEALDAATQSWNHGKGAWAQSDCKVGFRFFFIRI